MVWLILILFLWLSWFVSFWFMVLSVCRFWVVVWMCSVLFCSGVILGCVVSGGLVELGSVCCCMLVGWCLRRMLVWFCRFLSVWWFVVWGCVWLLLVMV